MLINVRVRGLLGVILPAGQAAQAPAPLNPFVVKPGAHIWQAVEFASAEKVPTGQSPHLALPARGCKVPGPQSVHSPLPAVCAMLPGAHKMQTDA